jgi:hypothetical protein
MAGCDEDRNIVRVRGRGVFSLWVANYYFMVVNLDPKPPSDQYEAFTGISYALLCIVMHCCAIGATGAPVNTN